MKTALNDIKIRLYLKTRLLPRMPLWPPFGSELGWAVSPPHISGVRRTEERGHGWTLYSLHVSLGLGLTLITVRKWIKRYASHCISASVTGEKRLIFKPVPTFVMA